MSKQIINEDYSKYDFKDPEDFVFRSKRGLTRSTVAEISKMKNEPEWMLNIRLKAYQVLHAKADASLGGRPVQDRF